MKIISGGQTGADRGGLDAAIELGIEHGGWCPKGRKAEDGTIPERYRLVETRGSDYKKRTELNVKDADVTVIFTADGNVTGGSRLTASFCRQHGRPCLVLNAFAPVAETVAELRSFFNENKPKVVNIAGNRATKAFGIDKAVKNAIVSTFKE
jgi:hypothetical protein